MSVTHLDAAGYLAWSAVCTQKHPKGEEEFFLRSGLLDATEGNN